VEGREQEYNDWYSNRHLGDLLAIPGVLSARRFKLSGTQVPQAPTPAYRYLAVYEVEAEDVTSFVNEMMARVGDGRMPISTAMSGDISPVFWEAL
jgi:hypothetical protein